MNKNIELGLKGVLEKNRIKNKNYDEDSQLTKLSSRKINNFSNFQNNNIYLIEKENSKSLFESKEKAINSKKMKLNKYNKHKDKKKLKSISKVKSSSLILSPRKSNEIIYKKENDINRYKMNKKDKILDKKEKVKEEINNLNSTELNRLEYEKAIILDKRTYLEYYFSLLKKKHLLLFTFIPTNDYNVMSLKISLFLVSFSLYLNINGFFFNDDTMHKIYKDNGVYNILAQIPQILYSSIISSIINMVLKALSLSEKDILKIKDEKSMMNAVKQSKKIEKYIKIKFVIFFIISLLLMLFFWYFISCFCAVYNNTQVILIKF